MSQHDFNIANQGFPSTRADLNAALQALGSNSSGATAPSTTYPYQFWYDSTTDSLKMRDETNSLWITIGTFNQGTGVFTPSLAEAGLGTAAYEDIGFFATAAQGAKADAALPKEWTYESAETTVTTASSSTAFSHGLGAIPKHWEVKLRCTTAADGYAVGDEIVLPALFTNASSLQFNPTISANATNITVSSSPNGWVIAPKAGGAVALITTSNYRLIARAK